MIVAMEYDAVHCKGHTKKRTHRDGTTHSLVVRALWRGVMMCAYGRCRLRRLYSTL